MKEVCLKSLKIYLLFFLHNVHMYIITAFTQLQSQVFFGYDTTSFDHHLAIICHSPPHLSSSVRLDGANTHFHVSPEIFDWVQAQALAGPLGRHSQSCV